MSHFLVNDQALMMSRNNELIGNVQEKFLEAKQRFLPDKGNDQDLLDKVNKHLSAYLMKQNIMRFVKVNFVDNGAYNLEGKFAEVIQFEEKVSKFFSEYLGDSFLMEEVHDVRCLFEELFESTPYEEHFKEVFITIRDLE